MSDPVYTLKMKQEVPVMLEVAETAGHRADKLADLCTKQADGSIDAKQLGITSGGKLTATVPTPVPFDKAAYLFVYGKIYPLQNTPGDYRLVCAFSAPGEFKLLDADGKEVSSKSVTLSGKLADITRFALHVNLAKD
jgi:hypothetical protein